MEKQISTQRKKFNEEHDQLNDAEVLKENLYAQLLIINKLEKIRINTSNLVWFLIVIPIILVIIAFMMGGF